MTEMTARERWLAVLKRERPDRIPMDFQGTHELVQKMLRYQDVPPPGAALRVDNMGPC